MLDDANVIKQRDPSNMLGSVRNMAQQVNWEPTIACSENDGRSIQNIVVAGMGGSALAPDMLRALASQQLTLPYEVLKGYQLPHYTGPNTLVVVVSHSGNTEETLNCYRQARQANAQIAAITAGGSLAEAALSHDVAHVLVPSGAQPRMSILYHLRALLRILDHFTVLSPDIYDLLSTKGAWLTDAIARWESDVPVHDNYAKQLALLTVGKTPIIYAGPLLAPLAYKWKISWNENAKNTAFTGTYPEFNHNEFIGWSSHPIEKPFAVIDLVSGFESIRIDERMQLSDQLLSGLRPKATPVTLEGDSLISHYLWGIALADMVSIYVAILNGVQPEPVHLVEKFKASLS